MVFNHFVPVCTMMGAARTISEVEHAFACWQRIIVAIWALNPLFAPISVYR